VLCISPDTGPFSNLPRSELFAPPETPPRTSTPRIADQTPRTLRSSSRDKPLSASSARSPALDSPSSPSVRGTSKKPPSRRGKSQLIDLTKSQDETVMDVDEVVLPPSISKRPQRRQEEEPESDDILRLLPSDSRPASSRAESASLPPAPHAEYDDEPDELDLLGSLTTSTRPSSSTSEAPRARSMTRRSSSAPSHKSPLRVSPEVMIVDSKEEATKVAPEDEPEDAQKSEPDLTREPMLVEDMEEVPADEEVDAEGEQALVSDDGTELLEIQEQPESELTPKVPVSRELTPVEDDDHSTLSEPISPPPPDAVPTGPFIPVVTANMPPRGQPLTIPTPSSPMPQPPPFEFEMDEHEPEAERTVAPAQTVHHFNPQYTLPPIKSLPVEFNRKGKLTKQQRKREKERERFERGSEKVEGRKDVKEEWVPIGLNRWGALLRANPVWRRMSRATKCLSTRDWNVCTFLLIYAVTLTLFHCRWLSQSCD
jgi:chromatin modification-related protein VID21